MNRDVNDVTKGAMVTQGKTKAGYVVLENPDALIMESRDALTKNDDPSATKEMTSKGKFSTITTSRVFELLKKAGIPVAYERQLSEMEFLAARCDMIPLEVVVRRYAVGSFLKRYPNLLKGGRDGIPHRFHRLVFELFLKTTEGKVSGKEECVRGGTPIDPESGRPIDDPFIDTDSLEENVWCLRHPKVPRWEKASDLKRLVFREDVLPPEVSVGRIEEIARKVFLILEGAWAQLGCRLIDFKIEFGIDRGGNLVVADVIDNDSWRLRTGDWQELSKQLFRDNFNMNAIADRYALVATLVERFAIPNQAIVLWRGSDRDAFPEVPEEMVGIAKVEVTQSGHKAPSGSLDTLEHILAKYPEGGVILALVGMSNGLGPMLAARTNWSVIAVPLTARERPHDVWSSLEVPSNVPLSVILSPKNAVSAALNILAQKNPVVFMERQYAIEALDR